MKKTILIAAILLSGCSSHKLNTSLGQVRSYGNEIDVTVIGDNPVISDKLERHIKAGLLVKGYDLSDEESATDLIVKIFIYTPGNAALRLTIGFGAGRGSLLYNAKYINNGKVLIDYDGAERFTGGEYEPGTTQDALANFGGEETSERILLEEAAKHITDLAI